VYLVRASESNISKLQIMSILSRAGVTPEMQFTCGDCNDVITGQQVLDGEYLYIVKTYPLDPKRSVWRCECCQDAREDQD
jgi:hypothetical protein